LFRS